MMLFFFSLQSVTPKPSGGGDHSLGRFLAMELQVVCMLLDTTSLSLFTFMHWKRKWQPTPMFFPGESQGRGSLLGCRLWGRTESDTAEAT
jgi:hypothetical protein